MSEIYLRDDMSNATWTLLEPHLPGRKGRWGGIGRDNRQFLNAVFWILRTGSRWRDLPPDYGDWKNTHRRFCRWRDRGTWEILLEKLMNEPNYEWLIMKVDHAPVPCRHANGLLNRQESTKKFTEISQEETIPRYIWPWMRMVCRSECLLQTIPKKINKIS